MLTPAHRLEEADSMTMPQQNAPDDPQGPTPSYKPVSPPPGNGSQAQAEYQQFHSGPAWNERERTHLPQIAASAFVSDTDRVTLANIQKIPLFPQIVRKLHEIAWDKIAYARNSAESVRCGPTQFRTMYDMMRESCAILHITEPELYLKQSEVFNAYTSGTNRTFIVVHSRLVEVLSDEELLFVIGHECGHIKAGHVLYQELGRSLIPLLEVLGQATMGLGQLAGAGLVAAFFEWMRQAELSCDRAGSLVCQNPQAALSALMKMGSGSTRFDNEMNLEVFLEQARQHSATTGMEGLSKALLFLMYNWQLTHPQVVYRAKGLDEWISSGAYDKVLSGDYPRDVSGRTQLGQTIKCPRCGKVASALMRFCPECGQDLQGGANTGAAQNRTHAVVQCPHCNAELAPGTKFCVSCGMSVG